MYEPPPGDTITLDFPGISDVLKIPTLDNKRARYERYLRWKTHVGAIPAGLQRAQQLLTTIDNWEDLLITLLTTGKLIAPRVLSRFLPGVGAIMLADQGLNLVNAILGTTLTGRTPKLRAAKECLSLLGGRAAEVKSASRLNLTAAPAQQTVSQSLAAGARQYLDTPVAWLPYILQAGQVSADWTGYGLQLGSIMACVSDAFWIPYQLWKGERVIIRAPPKDSFATQCAAVAVTFPTLALLATPIMAAEVTVGMLAFTNAIQYLADAGYIQPNDTALAQIAPIPYPKLEVWNQATVDVLTDMEGQINPDALPAAPRLDLRAPWMAGHFYAANTLATVERWGKNLLPPTELGQALAADMRTAAIHCHDLAAGTETTLHLKFTPTERYMLYAIEFNMLPGLPLNPYAEKIWDPIGPGPQRLTPDADAREATEAWTSYARRIELHHLTGWDTGLRTYLFTMGSPYVIVAGGEKIYTSAYTLQELEELYRLGKTMFLENRDVYWWQVNAVGADAPMESTVAEAKIGGKQTIRPVPWEPGPEFAIRSALLGVWGTFWRIPISPIAHTTVSSAS